jgi:hypothetical protein
VGLFLVRENPFRYILSTVWSSAVANVATHEAIYCLFPVTTLDQKEMQVFSCDSAEALRVYERFLQRGYKRILKVDVLSLGEYEMARFVGDLRCRVFLFSAYEGCQPTVFPRLEFHAKNGRYVVKEVSHLMTRLTLDNTKYGSDWVRKFVKTYCYDVFTDIYLRSGKRIANQIWLRKVWGAPRSAWGGEAPGEGGLSP